MSKQQKTQIIGSIVMIIALLIVGLIGGKFIMDTIYLFLIQESVAADANLIRQIVGYIATYNILHILFIGLSLFLIVIGGYLFYQDRKFKISLFVLGISVVTAITTFLNGGMLRLMGTARNLLTSTSEFGSYFEYGKDFVSVVARASDSLPATATSIALRSLIFDIFVLLCFLLLMIALILRLIDLRRYKKTVE